MAENTRVVEERLPAVKGMVIGAAETDTVDTDQGLADSRCSRFGRVMRGEFSGFAEDDGIHGR
jgi:hypothetical protein